MSLFTPYSLQLPGAVTNPPIHPSINLTHPFTPSICTHRPSIYPIHSSIHTTQPFTHPLPTSNHSTHPPHTIHPPIHPSIHSSAYPPHSSTHSIHLPQSFTYRITEWFRLERTFKIISYASHPSTLPTHPSTHPSTLPSTHPSTHPSTYPIHAFILPHHSPIPSTPFIP